MSFKSYAYVFLLGGVVLPTAVIGLALYYIFHFYTVPYTPQEAARKVSAILSDNGAGTTSNAPIQEKSDPESGKSESTNKPSSEKATFPAPKRAARPLAGWMVVRRNFHGREPAPSSGGKDVHEDAVDDLASGSGAATPSSLAGGGMTTAAARYSSLIKDSYLSFARGSNTSDPNSPSDTQTAGKAASGSSPSGMQERVFAVLKGKVLFLYSNETKSDCLGALDIEAFSVGISGGDDEDDEVDGDGQPSMEKAKMREGELFGKRSAIILRSVPRLEEADSETSPIRKRRSRSGMSRSNSTRSSKPSISGMPSLATFDELDGTRPKITRKSTPSAATELKHLSVEERSRLDPDASRPPAITALTRDMDNGTSGVPIPGERAIADASAARDKTILEVETEEKEKRRKEKKARDRRRTRIEGRPWYLFLRSNVKMEEWYHALLSISTPTVPSPGALDDLGEQTKKALEKLTPRPGFDEIFSKDDMKRLLDKLNTDPDQGNIRWLNGLIGRLFLGICKTAAVEAFIIERAMKKINKTKMPSWIEYIRIDEVDVGNAPPTFSNPMLKELGEDGTYAADINLDYEGEVRLKVSAAGSFSIRGTNLGRATAQLNVRILSIKGNLRFKINKPPSNRIWWCFSEPPQIVMHVEPILASRKMQLSALTRVIEKQIRDGIAEACVMPCYDDIPFFDTSNMRHRGGIFNDFAKQQGPGTVPISTEMTAEGLEAKAIPPGARPSSTITAIPPSVSAAALDPSARLFKGDIASHSDTRHVNSDLDAPVDGSLTSGLAKSLSGGTKKWFAGRSGSGDVPGSSTSALSSDNEHGKIHSRGGSFGSVPKPTVSKSSSDRHRLDMDLITTSATTAERPADQEVHPRIRSAEPESLSDNHPLYPSPLASDNREDVARQLDTSSGHLSSEQNPGSLMETIRIRAKDKQALQTSVNQAKDAMRKWGTNWAAKRNLPPTNTTDPPDESSPVTRDISVDRNTSTASPSPIHPKIDARSVDIPRSGLTLKERLANVTQLATSPPDRNVRRSTESEGSSWGGYLSQSVDSEDVADLGRDPASKATTQPTQHPTSKELQAMPPKIPKRPNAAKTASHAPKLVPSMNASKSGASAPSLPPRLNNTTNAEHPHSSPLEHTSGATTYQDITVQDVKHRHPVTIPPSLPSRTPLMYHADVRGSGDSDLPSPLPSPSLPTAEAALKDVIASTMRGEDKSTL
ncbi:hypothetical protein QFC22_001858 [Naganishia vaughanmartiniae]|uniref:Uncharacterized protein n=1 Tax=Naganishia vaughanmartiniae TaxID=1424756 RepID=A0ACC2XFL6_9TREE|nr:hypothetical protein QFC22_001858 [Naganishia vaughanmartiniae]